MAVRHRVTWGHRATRLLFPGTPVEHVAAPVEPLVAAAPRIGAELRRALDRTLVHGIAWNAALKLVAQCVAWGTTLVVARLLAATDYGIYGIAALWLGVVQMLTEFGIGTAVVTRAALTAEEIAQLNTVSVALGVAGALVACALAPVAGLVFHNRAVVGVVAVLSVTLVVSSFRSVPWGLLQRELRFKRLAVYDSGQAIALSLLTIVLALSGFRYWTLVIAAVMAATVGTVVTLARHPVPFARPDLGRLRPLLTYSRDVVVARLAWYAYMNADFIVAGRALGVAAAGYYGLAWSLAHMVVDKIAQLVFQVTPGVLSRVQGRPALLRRYFVQITAAMTLVFWPLCFGLAVVARDFVPVVLGPRWATTVVPLTILSAYSSVWIVLGFTGQVLLVIDEVAFSRRNNLQQLGVMSVTFAIGSRWGINGIALGWLLVHPILAANRVHRVLARLELPPARFVREALLPAAVGCAIMAATALTARDTILTFLTPTGRLAGEVLLGGGAYLAVQGTVFRRQFTAALRARRGLRQSAASMPQTS